MTTTTKRPGGRPSVDPTDQPVSVHVTLPAALYDKSYAAARRERVTVPEWIRQTLRQATATPKDATP